MFPYSEKIEAKVRLLARLLGSTAGAAPFLALAILFYLFVPATTSAEAGGTSKHTQRIVSLAPSMTELLFALDVQDRIVGVTAYCDYPKAALALPKVGGTSSPQFERILHLKPSHLLGVSDPYGLAAMAAQVGIEARFFPQRTVDELLDSIRGVGELVDREAAASALVGQLEDALQKKPVVTSQQNRAILLFWESLSGTSAYAAGAESLDAELMAAVGLNNVLESSQHYVQLSFEGIVSLEPDYLIVVAPGVDPEQAAARFETFRAKIISFLSLPSEQIILINNAAMLRPGPRTLEAISLLRTALQKTQ